MPIGIKPHTITMIDQDILGWDDQARRERAEEIVNEVCKQYSSKEREEMCRTLISSFNPYLQPEGYWYDPAWEVRPDGSIVMRELSIMPGYSLDYEDVK